MGNFTGNRGSNDVIIINNYIEEIEKKIDNIRDKLNKEHNETLQMHIKTTDEIISNLTQENLHLKSQLEKLNNSKNNDDINLITQKIFNDLVKNINDISDEKEKEIYNNMFKLVSICTEKIFDNIKNN